MFPINPPLVNVTGVPVVHGNPDTRVDNGETQHRVTALGYVLLEREEGEKETVIIKKIENKLAIAVFSSP